ncbi:Transcriptional regulator, IclR family [Bombilactobacillus mellifer]|uniref:Transcriptional regulator, IclR family n=1 Tax=Bombilactobacillus mellifer TaxID=1218492 RepID=A0A0F4LSY5_9LACO|nr:IclR family transcriptional regulator [Bombilactobacillus mellifer]KJY61700.1 Transcriptional regulator, IclR family [Bombilactobacillus mellifer]
MTDDASYNKTVINTFKILDAISNAHTAIGVSELAKTTGLPKTTVFRLLRSLEYVRVVEKNDQQCYHFGAKIITYSQNFERQSLLVQTALPLMKQFVKEVKENISIGILYNNLVLYLHSEKGERFPLQVNLYPISPLYCSSMGKIFLSNFSPAALTNYLTAQKFTPRTVNTIVNPQILRAEVLRAQTSKIAYDNEEYEYGLTCIGVPLYQQSKMIAAASVSGPTSRLKARGWDFITEKIINFGHQVSQRL